MSRWVLATALAATLGCAKMGWAQSAIQDVQVLGATNVQAALAYTAPTSAACAVEVSENPTFQPLVHDVNAALFESSALDSRPGSVSDGRSRIFVVGARAVHQASNRKWYSRALQTDTMHYFRIRCGELSVTGQFKTANLPVGAHYPFPLPQDSTGQVRWPSTDDNDRNLTIVDPNYGTLIKRVSIPGDFPVADGNVTPRGSMKAMQFNAASGNWTTPNASLVNDNASATAADAAAGPLALTGLGLTWTAFAQANMSANRITVRIRGSATGASPEDRTLDVCLTANGTSCRGDAKTVTLETRETTVTAASATLGDTWGEAIWPDEISGNARFGVLIRRRAGTGAVSVQHVEMDLEAGYGHWIGDSGQFETCAPVKSNGGYHCFMFQNPTGNSMFWIQPETGEVRFLGTVVATNWGGNNAICRSSAALFDRSDPNVYYCSAVRNNKLVVLRGTYSGTDQPVRPGAFADFTWFNLTPEPATLTDQMVAFDGRFDPAQFNCVLADATGQHLIIRCWRGPQDSVAWVGAFDTKTAKVVAMTPSWMNPNSRWCGLHFIENIANPNVIGWGTQQLRGASGAGTAPSTLTLTEAIGAGGNQITLRVSGEPQPYLMDAAPGDLFRFDGGGYDLVRIIEKRGPNEWLVERILINNAGPARSTGARLTAFCNGVSLNPRETPANPSYPFYVPSVYWNFVEDPRGEDTTHQKYTVENVMVAAHIVQRKNWRVMSHYLGYMVVDGALPATRNALPPSLAYYPGIGRFEGVRANLGIGNIDSFANVYQQHPSYGNYHATEPGRGNWFADAIPFIGSGGLTNGLSRISGTLYRANTAALTRSIYPTVGHCGGRQLKEVPAIGENDEFAFCVGAQCRPGAGANDVYVNCPAPVSTSSTCSMGGRADNVCIMDLAPWGQGITQFYFHNSNNRIRMLTNALHNWHNPRAPQSFATAYSLPDGSWMMFRAWGSSSRSDLYMVKVPPQPDLERTASAGSVGVSFNANPPENATIASVAVEYGSTPQLGSISSSRNCRGGQKDCDVSIRARPLEVVFARPVYYNAAGQVVARGPIQLQFAEGRSGAGVEKPRFARAAVVNLASFEQKLAPGGMTSIFGENLANCSTGAFTLPLPTTLCDSGVTFNGASGYLLFAAPSQLNVVMPSSIVPGADVEIVVDRAGQKSDRVAIPGAAVAATAPAVFAYQDGSVRRAVVINPDGATNGPAAPLPRGASAYLFANALGATNPPVPDGAGAPADPLSATSAPVKVFVNGVEQTVAFAGLAPGLAHTYQVNFTLNPATPVNAGDTNLLWLSVNGVESPRLAVTIAE